MTETTRVCVNCNETKPVSQFVGEPWNENVCQECFEIERPRILAELDRLILMGEMILQRDQSGRSADEMDA